MYTGPQLWVNYGSMPQIDLLLVGVDIPLKYPTIMVNLTTFENVLPDIPDIFALTYGLLLGMAQ